MTKITYIIPIHQFNDEISKYLTRCLSSVKNMRNAGDNKVIIVGQQDVVDKCVALSKELELPQDVTGFYCFSEDIFEKINLAVTKCVTPYFSVLEFDDEYYPYWDEVAQKELSKHTPAILFPLIEQVMVDGTIPALGNELAWNASFNKKEELGFITTEDLVIYPDFILSGAYINTERFLSSGKFDPEYKIMAPYQFMLRMSDSETSRLYVLPRVGYKHTIMREGSYMLEVEKEISKEEISDKLMKLISSYKKTEKTQSDTEE